MGPIPSVNVGSAGSPSYVPASTAQSAGTARAGGAPGGIGVGRAPTASGSTALTQIDAAVSQLLQSIGGGVENDKMLRMLIGLIILLALLRSSQGDVSSANNALLALAGGGNSAQSLGGSSSTTIAIEQTTTTIFFQTTETYAAASSGEQAQAKGGSIDAAV